MYQFPVSSILLVLLLNFSNESFQIVLNADLSQFESGSGLVNETCHDIRESVGTFSIFNSCNGY